MWSQNSAVGTKLLSEREREKEIENQQTNTHAAVDISLSILDYGTSILEILYAS